MTPPPQKAPLPLNGVRPDFIVRQLQLPWQLKDQLERAPFADANRLALWARTTAAMLPGVVHEEDAAELIYDHSFLTGAKLKVSSIATIVREAYEAAGYSAPTAEDGVETAGVAGGVIRPGQGLNWGDLAKIAAVFAAPRPETHSTQEAVPTPPAPLPAPAKGFPEAPAPVKRSWRDNVLQLPS